MQPTTDDHTASGSIAPWRIKVMQQQKSSPPAVKRHHPPRSRPDPNIQTRLVRHYAAHLPTDHPDHPANRRTPYMQAGDNDTERGTIA